MEICVIYNPAAARGRAERKLRRLRLALGNRAEFRPTQEPGHAETLALEAANAGFPTVAAAGGDGTVHEVANGLLRSGRDDVVFAVVPLGSANDYVYSLTANENNSPVRRVDVGIVRSGQGRERYFVNSLGLGFSGAVALESRKIRRLQGLALYGLAFLRALWRHVKSPSMKISVDGEERETPTLSLTVAIGRREGNFIVAPDAVLDDGLFDYLHVGPLSRWQIVAFMPRLATGGQMPADHPAIRLGRCREIRLNSTAPLTVHLDGEFFSRPEDDVRSLDVRILPRHLSVQAWLLPFSQ